MNLQQASAISAFASTLVVVIVTLVRQRKFDRTDLGPYLATFLAGYNLPAAYFLCMYVFDPDPPELLSKAKIGGMDKYFAVSGLALLFLSLMSIWTFIQSAYKTKTTSSS